MPSFGTLKALVILLDGVAFALALWITVIVFSNFQLYTFKWYFY